MSRGRLGKYAVWQFRDFVMDRGIAIIIIGLLWGYVLIEPLRRAMGSSFAATTSSSVFPLLVTVSSSIVSLAVLIALNGIVSTDRKLGYYRFLFAKPVSRVGYYVQVFVVYMIGVLAAMLLLALALHSVAPAFNVLNFILYAALIYVAMGGIGFFISVATRFDWLTLAAVWLGSRVLRDVYGAKPGFTSKLVELLPPVHKLNDVALTMISGAWAPTRDVLWLLGYGAAFFLLGILLLQRGSLAD
jgi:hypothetical protein